MSIQSSVSEQARSRKQTVSSLPVKKSRKSKDALKTTKRMTSDAIYISDHTLVVNHRDDVGIVSGVQTTPETHKAPDTADIINDITHLWRMRQRWHRAEKSLILQGKAFCRSIVPGGDKKLANDLFEEIESGTSLDEASVMAMQPFLLSIDHFKSSRIPIEKELSKLARKLPAYNWIKSIYGVGDLGFYSIIGECGDISKYKSVSALWKRMGLAVIDGGRQRCVKNTEAAFIHGYKPARRSVMWNVGTNLIGGMGHGKRPNVGEDISTKDWTKYQKLFVERCRYECAKNPDNMALKIVEKNGEQKDSYPVHVQARAKRYVEKRFLRDLYAQWKNTA